MVAWASVGVSGIIDRSSFLSNGQTYTHYSLRELLTCQACFTPLACLILPTLPCRIKTHALQFIQQIVCFILANSHNLPNVLRRSSALKPRRAVMRRARPAHTKGPPTTVIKFMMVTGEPVTCRMAAP